MSIDVRLRRQKRGKSEKFARDVPIEETMSRAEWLAPIEEAITNRTPDPLAERSE